MNRLRQLLAAVRGSFWFVPALVVLASVAAAALLVEVDAARGSGLAEFSHRLFGASAAGSRSILSAIATSMMTVAGVVFSITVVVLSQASSQFSPRVLRNFMRDLPTQLVLGVFVGVFAYSLIVLRTVRGTEEGFTFIPSLAILGALLYALAGVAMLIYFIHHVAQSIQASTIIDRIATDARAAIDHLFPQDVGSDAAEATPEHDEPETWTPVTAPESGYVVRVDAHAVMQAACGCGRVIRLAMPVGAFVAEDAVLLELSGSDPIAPRDVSRLRRLVQLGRQRTTEQDAAFALQQLVDLGVKALSPGINDPTTATMCIDRLGALLARLARRRMPDPQRADEGRLRVIVPELPFGELLALAFGPLLAHSRGDLQVLGRLVRALEAVAACASSRARRADVGAIAGLLEGKLAEADTEPARPSLRAVQRLLSTLA